MATVTISKPSTVVNRAISGTTTVNANCYAIVTYGLTSAGGGGSGITSASADSQTTRYFGPGATIPATYSGTGIIALSGGVSYVGVVFSLESGVEFINS